MSKLLLNSFSLLSGMLTIATAQAQNVPSYHPSMQMPNVQQAQQFRNSPQNSFAQNVNSAPRWNGSQNNWMPWNFFNNNNTTNMNPWGNANMPSNNFNNVTNNNVSPWGNSNMPSNNNWMPWNQGNWNFMPFDNVLNGSNHSNGQYNSQGMGAGKGLADAQGEMEFDFAMSFKGRGKVNGDTELNANTNANANTNTQFNSDNAHNNMIAYNAVPAAMQPQAMVEATASVPAPIVQVVLLDDDKDGVANPKDLCESTAPGVVVDAFGCDYDSRLVLKGVNFKTNSDQLIDTSLAILDTVSITLSSNPNVKVRVEGFTDSDGDAVYNKDLSLRRAQQVVTYLISKNVNPDNLSAAGFGEENPISANDTKEGKALNRRVELTRQ